MIAKNKLGSQSHRMLVLRKGLKYMWFIDGRYVAHDVTPHPMSLIGITMGHCLKLASILSGQLFR